jgi:hypothetical protein
MSRQNGPIGVFGVGHRPVSDLSFGACFECTQSHILTFAIRSEDYFGTEREKEDVQTLWNQPREYCDAIVLIKDFVISLSKLWHVKWPKELVQMYIEAYVMYREHFDHPQVFSNESPFTEVRDDALATLLYGELLNFSCPK